MIYLDNAATTPILPNVYHAMLSWIIGDKFGNPSSLHSAGREAREAIETARQQVADLLNASSKDEIIFTSGGTESDNLAIQGIMWNDNFPFIMVSSIEHHAILHQNDVLSRECGVYMDCVPVDRNGIVDLEWMERTLDRFKGSYGLVSVMLVNNETGVIQPLKEIVRICHERDILVHTDAVQAVGHMDVDVQDLGVDLLSLSGHKFGAPDGIGALYVKESIRSKLSPLIYGGKQERGTRAGTENVASIVGMGVAAQFIKSSLQKLTLKYNDLRELFISSIQNELNGSLDEVGIRVNGSGAGTVSNILSLTVSGVESESLLLLMDADDVCISAASACSAGSLEPSHVLTAMGMSEEEAHSTVRISFGERNNYDDAVQAGRIFAKNVNRIRAMYGGNNEK